MTKLLVPGAWNIDVITFSKESYPQRSGKLSYVTSLVMSRKGLLTLGPAMGILELTFRIHEFLPELAMLFDG